MATIANLNVKLTAGIGGFAAGMKTAGAQLSSFTNEVTASAAKIGGMATGLTALATGGGLGLLVKNQMEAIDVNAKLADRLNATTAGLVALHHAGDLAGIGGEQLNTALTRMQKSIAGVAEDGIDVSGVFGELGLKASDLANMKADDAFGRIAEEISKIENATQRAGIEAAIFGRQVGTQLDAMLMQGASGIAAAREETEKLGTSYSRVDAAKVEQANDAMTRMSKVFTGIGTQLAVEIAPFIEAAADNFTELATSGKGTAAVVVDGFQFVAIGIAKSTDYVNLLTAGFYGFRAGAVAAIADVLDGLRTIASIPGASLISPALGMLSTDALKAQADGLRKVATEEAAKVNEAMANFHSGKNASAAAAAFEDLRAKADSNAKAMAESADKMNSAAFAASNLAETIAAAAKGESVIADLQKQIDEMGMTEAGKQLSRLDSLGLNPDDLKRAKELTEQLQQMEAARRADAETAKLAAAFAEEFAAPSVAEAETPAHQLLAVGSAAAERFQFEQSRAAGSAFDKALPEKQLAEMVESNDTLGEINRGIRELQRQPFTLLDSF